MSNPVVNAANNPVEVHMIRLRQDVERDRADLLRMLTELQKRVERLEDQVYDMRYPYSG